MKLDPYDKRKYVVYGCNVVSKHDGDTHFISARRVTELFRVDPHDCLFISDALPFDLKVRKAEEVKEQTGMRILCPSEAGDYVLPK